MSCIPSRLKRGSHEPTRSRSDADPPRRPHTSPRPPRRPRLALQPSPSPQAVGLIMQVRPIINAVQATLVSQATVASNDPAVEAAVNQLVEALGPALQVAAMEIAEQA